MFLNFVIIKFNFCHDGRVGECCVTKKIRPKPLLLPECRFFPDNDVTPYSDGTPRGCPDGNNDDDDDNIRRQKKWDFLWNRFNGRENVPARPPYFNTRKVSGRSSTGCVYCRRRRRENK